MGERYSIEQWREAKAAMSSAQFEERYPQLFLVRLPTSVSPNEVTPGTAQRVEFHTMASGNFNPAAVMRTQPLAPTAGAVQTDPLVLPLMKDPANPFPDRISIGRAPNCDIVIRESSVSKLHGHFRDVTTETAVFTDAHSANGSRVNAMAMEPGAPVVMRRQDELLLGRVKLKLMSAADLYRWL